MRLINSFCRNNVDFVIVLELFICYLMVGNGGFMCGIDWR